MGRGLRAAAIGAVVMLTSRTVDGRFWLLADSDEVRAICAEVLAYVQGKHKVVIYGEVVMSTHFHIQVRADSPGQIADFMRDFKSMVARRVNAHRGRQGTFWDGRYDLQECSDEGQSQLEQLAYVLAHGAKEGLVAEPQDWPGLSAARALLDGAIGDAGLEAGVVRSVLPGLAHLSEDELREVLRAEVARVVGEVRIKSGIGKVTRKTPILTDWWECPDSMKRSRDARKERLAATLESGGRRRRFRAVEKEREEAMADARAELEARYAEASLRFRGGKRAVFPAWTFPPRLPMCGGQGLVVAGIRGLRARPPLPT